ncbi:MAG TPA: DsbA family protein, partial [Caldimonas sp.]
AARAFCWVKRHHRGREASFAGAVYDRYWRLGRDLSQAEELKAVAPIVGIEAEALAAGVQSEESRTDLRDAVAAALERGVFGSPFIIVDGEPFWGSDRLELVDEWLTRGGW